MALAMQQALELFPSRVSLVHQLERQAWWRAGVELIALGYLSDQTWELTVVYDGRPYAVVYDALDGRCDSIEPLFLD